MYIENLVGHNLSPIKDTLDKNDAFYVHISSETQNRIYELCNYTPTKLVHTFAFKVTKSIAHSSTMKSISGFASSCSTNSILFTSSSFLSSGESSPSSSISGRPLELLHHQLKQCAQSHRGVMVGKEHNQPTLPE